MPTGMGEEERFAAAVEHGTTPASHGRGAGSADSLARELEIVALLRSGGPALGPEPAARERAKRRMMAAFAQEFGQDLAHAGDDGTNAEETTGPLPVVTSVAVAERPPARHAEPTRRSAEPVPLRAGRHSAPESDGVEEPDLADDDAPELGNVRRLRSGASRGGRAPRRGHGRAALIGAAAAAALVALAGTGTFASRDALPGDPMYGVKRVAESTSYALTFGEQAKARRHLEQAQRRLDEVEGMVNRSRTAAPSPSAPAAKPDQELLQSTMQEFDTDTTEGSRLLLAGPTPPDTAQVDEVRTWATEQSGRLSEIKSALPAPDRADESLALLNRVLGETDALTGAACQPAEAVTGSAADVDACGPSGSSSSPALTNGVPVPTPEDGARSGDPSGTDDQDGDPDADTDTDSRAGTSSDDDGGENAAKASTTRSDSDADSDSDDRSRRDDGSGGSGGGSGGSAGSGDVSVPLPLPAKVGLPSVGGLPGLSIGGR